MFGCWKNLAFNIILLFDTQVQLFLVKTSFFTNLHIVNLLSVNISMVFYTSIILMGLYILTMTTFSSAFNLDVEAGISLFYFTLFLLSVLPFSVPGSEYRIQFYRLLKIVFFPTNVITFPEVLLADALTSMARTFKDIAVTILVLYCHFMNENIIHYHDFGILSIAILTSLPYWYAL